MRISIKSTSAVTAERVETAAATLVP